MTSPMNPTPNDTYWRALVAAETPTADELANEEQALARLAARGQHEPLSAAELDRLVAQATQARPGGARLARLLGGLGPQRRLLLSALLLVSVASIAWVGIRLLWPGQTHAPHTLDYATAVQLATQPNRNDAAYLSAIGVISAHCYGIVDVLQGVRMSTDAALSNEAARILTDLGQLLRNGPTQVAPPVEDDPTQIVMSALDDRVPVSERLTALAKLSDLATAGLTAVGLARLEAEESELKRQSFVASLLRKLDR